MKKFFSLLMALMMVLSVSARVPASLKMMQSKKQAAAEAQQKAAPRMLTTDEEDEYYEGEPTTPTSLSFTFATSIELDASYADEGSYMLYVSGSDYALQLMFALESTSQTIPAGTYSISDESGVISGISFWGYMYGSILATASEDYFYLTSGTVTIAYGQDNAMTLTVAAKSYYGSTVNMTVTGAVEEYNPYNYDWEPTEKTTINFTPTKYALEDYIEDYEIAMITLENDVYSMFLEYIAESLTDNKIPAGTYNIDFSNEYGTFSASVGGDDSYDYGCFIATDFEEGYYSTAYYLVSGTVTISYAEDGAMTITVNATTYNGSTVNVTYTQGATPTPPQGEGIVIVIADYQNDGGDGNFTSVEGVQVAVAANGGTAPTAKAGQNDFDLRLYAKNTLTITYAEGIEQIQFYISEKGMTRQAEIAASTGSMSYDMTNKVVTWTGNATTVTFTVGALNVYGTDGKTKAGQFDFTKIVINGEGGDTPPTPPTPTGNEITIAQAEAIAGALAEGATTTETYTIKGYVGTLYESGNFWLVAEAGGRSDLQVYKPTVDRALTKGDYVQVVGKLQKYVSKAGNTILEVVSATVTHIGDTPVPPTPIGDGITVAQAEAVAGALAEGATTTETYTIVCYAGTTYAYNEQFQNQDFWLVDTKGDKAQTLEAYRSKVDNVVAEGDYISITGQLQKYKAKSGKIILEVVNGTTKHLSETALLEIMKNAKVKKMLMEGKVIILHGNKIFDLSGMQIK